MLVTPTSRCLASSGMLKPSTETSAATSNAPLMISSTLIDPRSRRCRLSATACLANSGNLRALRARTARYRLEYRKPSGRGCGREVQRCYTVSSGAIQVNSAGSCALQNDASWPPGENPPAGGLGNWEQKCLGALENGS